MKHSTKNKSAKRIVSAKTKIGVATLSFLGLFWAGISVIGYFSLDRLL